MKWAIAAGYDPCGRARAVAPASQSQRTALLPFIDASELRRAVRACQPARHARPPGSLRAMSITILQAIQGAGPVFSLVRNQGVRDSQRKGR